jgi:CubicO group peptidase (beta-lactamase class C family)
VSAEIDRVSGPLRALIQASMERFSVPGVAVGLAWGEAAYLEGFGVTSVENPLSVTPQTIFQLGSITKTVTATAVVQFVEQGRLTLDAPIRTYLPTFRLRDPIAMEQATLRDVLTHRGGWLGEFFEDCGPGDDALTRFVERLATVPQIAPLRHMYSHSHSGFCVAGRVLEQVTGQTYESVAAALILEPLAMKTSFFFPEQVVTHRFSVGHQIIRGSAVVAYPWWLGRSNNSGAGLMSTAEDMLRYARAHIGNSAESRGFLSDSSRELMQSPIASATLDEFVGLSWFVRDYPQGRVLRHGGGTVGQVSTLYLVPQHEFALVLFANATTSLNYEVASWVLEHALGIVQPRAAFLTAALGRGPVEKLRHYEGTYEASVSRLKLQFLEGGLALEVTLVGVPHADPPPESPPPMRLGFIGPERVVVLDPPWNDMQGDFVRDRDGRVAWFRLGGKTYVRR